jgi:hypothetical protein
MTKKGRPVGTGKYKDGTVTERQYEISHPEQLIEYYRLGYLDCQIYAAFGICKDTFYTWLNEHAKFKKAHDVGMPICEAHWIDQGIKQMKGEVRGSNFNYWIALMNNKFKWAKGTYGDNQTNITTNVAIQNMNVLQQKGKLDLIDYIKRIGQKNEDVLDAKFIELQSDQSNGNV